MNKFQIKKEKLPVLTLQDIRDLGWVEKTTNPKSSIVNFQKDNYFLTCYSYKDIPVIRIFAVDPSIIDWMPDPENFRIICKCPSKEFFEIITSVL